MQSGRVHHSEIRGILVLLALEDLHLSSELIGNALKRDPSGLRKLACRIKKKATSSCSLSLEIETVRKGLYKIWPSDSQS